MNWLAQVLPDLGKFDEASITPVAKGFNIPHDAVGVWSFADGLAYLARCSWWDTSS